MSRTEIVMVALLLVPWTGAAQAGAPLAPAPPSTMADRATAAADLLQVHVAAMGASGSLPEDVLEAAASLVRTAGRAADLVVALDRAPHAPFARAQVLLDAALPLIDAPPPRALLPALPRFASARDAFESLLAGPVTAAPPVQAFLEGLAKLPASGDAALARIVSAQAFQSRATSLALSDSAAPDVGLLVAARDAVAREVLAAAADLVPVRAPGFTLCGVAAVDLAGVDSTYTCDVPLLIDLGGDDLYTNNAGGGMGTLALMPAALLVDRGEGSDRYLVDKPFFGAGAGGGYQAMGFLLDDGGDDTYRVRIGFEGAATGGARFGSGTLLDLGGTDSYTADIGSLGGDGGANGGGNDGPGLLLDLDGNDAYRGRVGLDGGINGASQQGIALLVDAAGDDTYEGEVGGFGAVNGGSQNGASALLDLGGSDAYTGTTGQFCGINGSGNTGAGFLLDTEGDDRYVGSCGSAAINGGAIQGAGALLDLAGDDTYDGAGSVVSFINGGTLLGAGLLLDSEGTDTYREPGFACQDCSVVPKGSVGAQVDEA